MTNLPPVDMAIASPEPTFAGDEEPNRMPRLALRYLSQYDGSHDYAYSWGYTIFRTVYTPGSDEAVATAVERLAVYARYWALEQHNRLMVRLSAFDNRPNEDLWSRYYSELVEDEQTLANLSESEVGERFDAWIRQHIRPRTTPRDEPNARFQYCLMLDEESLENILALPEDPLAPPPYPAPEEDEGEGWVKVISNWVMTEDDGGPGRYWLRVGIVDYLFDMWFYSFDSDILIQQMGWSDAEDGVQNLWGTPLDWHDELMAAHSG